MEKMTEFLPKQTKLAKYDLYYLDKDLMKQPFQVMLQTAEKNWVG